MDVSLIYVPFMAGDAAHPVAQAPARYARAGAERLLAGNGVLAGVSWVDIGPAARRIGPDAAAAVSQVLRQQVRQAVTAGQFPPRAGRLVRRGDRGRSRPGSRALRGALG